MLVVTRNLIDDSAVYVTTMNVNTINPLRAVVGVTDENARESILRREGLLCDRWRDRSKVTEIKRNLLVLF